VALFAFHLQRGDPYKVMELALVYLVVWVSLFITGPGRFSLDGLILKKARSAPCAE
jgi:putative oxidoreductase